MASQKAAKRDEIASHTLRMLKEHYSGKLRLSDVKEMFVDEGSCLKAKGNQEERMTVLIYVNTSKQVGDPDHLKVFADEDAAETWLQENDPEGVAFEYEVLE